MNSDLTLLLLYSDNNKKMYIITSDKGGGKCICPRLFVRLSVCLIVGKITQQCVHGFE